MDKEYQPEKIGAVTFRKIDTACAREIAGWQYAPPYEIYNFSPSEVEQNIQWLLTPQYRYFSVWDEACEQAGFHPVQRFEKTGTQDPFVVLLRDAMSD